MPNYMSLRAVQDETCIKALGVESVANISVSMFSIADERGCVQLRGRECNTVMFRN